MQKQHQGPQTDFRGQAIVGGVILEQAAFVAVSEPQYLPTAHPCNDTEPTIQKVCGQILWRSVEDLFLTVTPLDFQADFIRVFSIAF